MIAGNGTTLRSEILGQLLVRSYLSGMPDLKLGLNDKLQLTANGQPRRYVRADMTRSPSPKRAVLDCPYFFKRREKAVVEEEFCREDNAEKEASDGKFVCGGDYSLNFFGFFFVSSYVDKQRKVC